MSLNKKQNANLFISAAKEKIDTIDRQIINLIAERHKHIKSSNIQDQANSVRDFQTILEQIKTWALAAGLHPNLVNKISQYLIDYYITEALR